MIGDSSLEPLPACMECGACCFSNLETSVRVSGDDYARLGDAAERLVRFVGNRAYMRWADGHCAALRVDASGQLTCTVYPERPQICRDLERGSAACAGERATKGARPRERLIALRRAAHGEPR